MGKYQLHAIKATTYNKKRRLTVVQFHIALGDVKQSTLQVY